MPTLHNDFRNIGNAPHGCARSCSENTRAPTIRLASRTYLQVSRAFDMLRCITMRSKQYIYSCFEKF